MPYAGFAYNCPRRAVRGSVGEAYFVVVIVPLGEAVKRKGIIFGRGGQAKGSRVFAGRTHDTMEVSLFREVWRIPVPIFYRDVQHWFLYNLLVFDAMMLGRTSSELLVCCCMRNIMIGVRHHAPCAANGTRFCAAVSDSVSGYAGPHAPFPYGTCSGIVSLQWVVPL